jgi:hypothetical protein
MGQSRLMVRGFVPEGKLVMPQVIADAQLIQSFEPSATR